MTSQCQNCGANSDKFVQSDPKIEPDKKKTKPFNQIRNIPLTAALLSNKEKDDERTKTEVKLEPWTVEIDGPANNEKFLDDNLEDEDFNEQEDIYQTWLDLAGDN